MAIKITKGNKSDLSAIPTLVKGLNVKLMLNYSLIKTIFLKKFLMTCFRKTYDYLLVLEKI